MLFEVEALGLEILGFPATAMVEIMVVSTLAKVIPSHLAVLAAALGWAALGAGAGTFTTGHACNVGNR